MTIVLNQTMKSITLIFSLLTFFSIQFNIYSQSEKLINSSISIKGDPAGIFANTVVGIINSILYDDEDCYDYYYEDDCNRVNGIRMVIGGEFKLNFNLHQHLTLSGGYRVSSIPYDKYGKEIISRGFYVEPHINLSNDNDQTPFIFGQFGKTSFSQERIINHWQYTFGFGYKYEGTSIDLGYNLYNKPLEQEQEFYINDNLFQAENSFLSKGYAMVRFTADLF